MKAKITVNKNNKVGQIDRRIYGSFIEHLGRAVYNGIYEPTHITADDMGFRGDVLELINQLNIPIVRYPGGNFVSGYNWEDGIGDKSKRPHKLDLAWLSIETNEVGIDEFQEWAKRANTDVMMAVNLGTRGPDEARSLIEYCNGRTNTYYANLRRKNGFDEPFGIKLWCLGNEMDGDWQICHKTAEEYGRAATETAKVLKWIDPDIELVACGSSDPNMPTYGEWERTVLDHTYDYIDYLSLHCYYGNKANNTLDFLARAEDMDRFIKNTANICDEIKAKKNSEKTVNLSFDEWNVWYRTKDEEKSMERWQIAPHLLEEKYNFEDALLVGCMLMTLQNNCDRVKIACLAQLVNVIAPIMTENGGKAWKQTIFYPYMYASLYGNGATLKVNIESDAYKSGEGWDIPYLCTSVIDNKDRGEVVVFAVNRSLEENMELQLDLDGFDGYTFKEHIELYCDDLNTVNSKDSEKIHPNNRYVNQAEPIILQKHSWNMLIFCDKKEK
ncbi:MAG: alpha-N-arabinofuranosidase [Clostridia bacterium]|nr:alpha-N-arabinofuranosidase [Clostridia bacterium]